MERLTAQLRITTPMFIGDASQQASSISAAAVKGALRFWWRALNWGRLRNTKSTNEAALKQLHLEEAELFGSSAGMEATQASFKISVKINKLTTTKAGSTHKNFQRHDASRYLGYGVMEAFASHRKGTNAGQLTRDLFNEDQAFTVSFLSRKAIPNSLIDAIKAFGLLGSLGSRSRHGMGSVTLETIQRDTKPIWSAPSSKEAYAVELKKLATDLNELTPPFSAFSRSSRIDVLLSAATPYQVLDGFARRQLMYRSWGRDGRVLNEDSERRFKKDHDWSKGDKPNNFHPQRVVFGLPHNYGAGNHLSVTAETYDRRSSPLLFHVHKVGAEYLGVSTLLKSDFLPEGERINAGGKKVPVNIEWDILHEFLDGSDKQGKVRFADKEKVL